MPLSLRRVLQRSTGLLALALFLVCASTAAGKGGAASVRIHLRDGRVIEVEEAWEDAQGVWYRRDGIAHLVERERVRSIERDREPKAEHAPAAAPAAKPARRDATPVWILLKGGAKFEVDQADEADEGVWYKRHGLAIFIEKGRVERIERGESAAVEAEMSRSARSLGWTTGKAHVDNLIRESGARHGVDPYLIFLVMEQESHFNTRAVSHKGARGLMQLMPATARRFGVRNVHDAAQNIEGGTRYLKELIGRFDGRVDLVLAGYNAGEGAVMRYGGRVPPYAETRNYVKRIGSRYGAKTPAVKAKPAAPAAAGGED